MRQPILRSLFMNETRPSLDASPITTYIASWLLWDGDCYRAIEYAVDSAAFWQLHDAHAGRLVDHSEPGYWVFDVDDDDEGAIGWDDVMSEPRYGR